MQSNSDFLAANPGATILDVLAWQASRTASLPVAPKPLPAEHPGHGVTDTDGYVWFTDDIDHWSAK